MAECGDEGAHWSENSIKIEIPCQTQLRNEPKRTKKMGFRNPSGKHPTDKFYAVRPLSPRGVADPRCNFHCRPRREWRKCAQPLSSDKGARVVKA